MKLKTSAWVYLSLLVTVLPFASCAVQETELSAELVPASGPKVEFILREGVRIRASNAASTQLRIGTTWQTVGMIEQGTVLRSPDQVVVLNGYNVHEGYIVVQNEQVVGYYLPVGKTFVKVKPKKVILVERGTSNEG